MTSYMFDACALIALLKGENGAAKEFSYSCCPGSGGIVRRPVIPYTVY